MARGCFFINEVTNWSLLDAMVDIGTSDKITNLWPTQPSRPVNKATLKDKSSQNQQQKKKQQDKSEVEDGPGKNIDEYA